MKQRYCSHLDPVLLIFLGLKVSLMDEEQGGEMNFRKRVENGFNVQEKDREL